MTEQEKRYMEIAMNASEVSIAACLTAQADGYLKMRHSKSRLLDAIVELKFAVNMGSFTEEDVDYMAKKYEKLKKER